MSERTLHGSGDDWGMCEMILGKRMDVVGGCWGDGGMGFGDVGGDLWGCVWVDNFYSGAPLNIIMKIGMCTIA